MLLRVGQNNAFLVLNETETVSRNWGLYLFLSVTLKSIVLLAMRLNLISV